MDKVKSKKYMIITIILIVFVIIFIACYIFIKDIEKNNLSIITEDEWNMYTEPIFVTIDNWKDYVEIENGELRIKNTNVCGYLSITLKIKNTEDLFAEYTNEISEFKVLAGKIEPVEAEIVDEHFGFYNFNKIYEITTNDFECIEINSNLYSINLPENVWNDENYIIITKDGQEEKYYKNNYIESLSRNIEKNKL